MNKSIRIFILSIFLSPFAFTQELTSDIAGVVTSADGAVSGARVEITYVPTNTTVVKVSGANGQFFAGGLRPGGPYKVKVSADGLLSDTASASLVVGETARITFSLSSVGDVDDVVVVGQKVAVNEAYGFTTTIDAETIQNTPSVTRDLKDLVKLNPLVSLDDAEDDYEAISIAGAHPRSNDIKVDGVSFNDDFGLNANGYPSQRSPVNFDSIEQLSIKVAPVSVEYSNFRGGVIEIVTKGGTNEFEGSVGYYDRGDQFYGDSIEGRDYTFDKEDTAQGMTFGGPIIKDKAFFYVTYEESTITNPVLYGPAGTGAQNEQTITVDQVAQIRQFTVDNYGFDPLSYPTTTESNQENSSVRLDYIINDDHRVQWTYKNTQGDRLRAEGGFDEFYFQSASYLKTEETDAYSLLLISSWADNLVSEVYWSTKTTETGQNSPAGQNVPSFTINNAYGNEVYLGADIFRSANELENTTDYLKAKLNYYSGNHKITAGIENQSIDVVNLFIVAQDGQWEFDTIDDYYSGNASDFFANNAKSGNPYDAAADFGYSLTSLYLMDEITISDRLSITLGLRYDEYDSDDEPARNPDFEAAYGFANAGIDGTSILNYRFGMDLVLDDVSDINLVYGTYSSKFPTVWISNAYTNDGVRVSAYDSDYAAPGCNPASAPGTGLPGCVQQAITDAPLTSAKIDFISPSFEWPESEVLNLTYSRDLSDTLQLEATYLWSKQEEALYKIIDGSPLVGDQPQVPTLTAPDGRPIYNQTGRSTYKAGLYNDCCGTREVLSLSLTKSFNDGDGQFRISYTNQNIEELSGMTSSTSNSNFGKTGAIDYNNRKAMTSIYETEHRLLAALSSTHYFFGEDSPTTFTLVFERKSGLPGYPTFDTYTGSVDDYQTKAFGYDFNLNDDSSALLYIPTGVNDPIICWSYKCGDEGSAEAQARAVQVVNLLHDVYGLGKYAGQIAPRGSFNYPWQSSLDFKITQVLPGFRADDEVIITLGIENLLNLIDDNKGVVRYGYYSGRIDVIDLRIVDDKYDYSGYAFRYNPDRPFEETLSVTQSVWRAQLGFKYKF